MTSPQRFLAEWYVQECAAEDIDRIVEMLREITAGCRAQPPVQLVATLAIPADEMVFGLFDAPSAEAVLTECERVGLSPFRINVAVADGSRVLG